MEKLPEEVINCICCRLKPIDILHFSSTSQHFMLLMSLDDIWKPIYLERWTAPKEDILLPQDMLFKGNSFYWKHLFIAQQHIQNFYKFRKIAQWTPDIQATECNKCHIVFSVIRRKHHCRSCGKVFCNNCSYLRTELPNFNYIEPQRVCSPCWWLAQILRIAPQKENVLKLVAIGDRGSGKSTLIHKFMTGNFVPMDSTIGASIYSKEMKINHGGTLKLEVWDTSGSQGFNTMHSHYYKVAHVVLLFFSLADDDALVGPQLWYDKISAANQKVLFVLVGTKSDIKNDHAKFNSELQAFLSSRNFIAFKETSSKLDVNVQDLFEDIVNNNDVAKIM